MADAVDARSRRLRAERTELIGWLAGAVAHDVNNVLTAIAGYADLIEADLAADDPRAADTTGIRDAVLRAGELVRQLLTVGRRQTLRLEVLDASHLVKGLLPLLTSACGDKIRVLVPACPEPAAVLADRSLLEQAVLNLAVNARDAMPAGGTLTLRVSIGPGMVGLGGTMAPGEADPPPTPAVAVVAAAPAGNPADEVRIAVEDTGVGIEGSVLPYVFEPYFTTKDHDRGNGIGLASVVDATVQCGGRVSVDSRVGEGSRFVLHLPRSSAEPPRYTAVRVPGRFRGGDETILVVDADPEVRLVVARMLRRLGYTVADAANARQAMALIDGGLDRLDLLVTETALPEMSGSELAARVRAVHPDVSALLLSRTARNPGRSLPGVLPEDRILAKPISLEQLASTLRLLLDPRVAGALDA